LLRAYVQAKLKRMMQYLADNYTYSVNGNSKKGGLIALAACVIGLQQDTFRFLHMIIPPVLKCFSDVDHRVRYYACEALYNISKVSEACQLLPHRVIHSCLSCKSHAHNKL
jgi:vacuole morphology and inheritance protein 14